MDSAILKRVASKYGASVIKSANRHRESSPRIEEVKASLHYVLESFEKYSPDLRVSVVGWNIVEVCNNWETL